MIESIQALWNEWQYARNIGYSFLTNVAANDLQKKFPRKNLNSILAQYNELYEIQQDYVDAIDSKSIEFTGRNLQGKKGSAIGFVFLGLSAIFLCVVGFIEIQVRLGIIK